MNRTVLMTLGFVLILAVSVKPVFSSLTECAPEADVNAALAKAELRATESLGAEEAHQLVKELQESGIKHPDGTICFTDADFEEFGSLVSDFYSTHVSEDTIRMEEFDFEQEQQTKDGGKTCICRTCPKDHETYCTAQSEAVCCPHYCANIFGAVALAALSRVEGSGLETCCNRGKKACLSPRVVGQRAAGAPPKKTKREGAPPPEIDFRRSEGGEDIVFQTDTTSVNSFTGGFIGGPMEIATVSPSPTVSLIPSTSWDVSPSPRAALGDFSSISPSPSWSLEPSQSFQWSESPSPSAETVSTVLESPLASPDTPVTADAINPMPPGPTSSPEREEFEDISIGPLGGETNFESIGMGVDGDIQESPEDLVLDG